MTYPAAGDRALSLRLLTGHGISRNRQPGGLQGRRHATGHRQGAAGDALEVGRVVITGRINVCRRPLAAVDRVGAGCGEPYRIAADIQP